MIRKGDKVIMNDRYYVSEKIKGRNLLWQLNQWRYVGRCLYGLKDSEVVTL